RAVASVANLLDLELAVVAGSVALGFGEPFFAAARVEIARRARMEFSARTRIEPAGLGALGPLVGAGAVGGRLYDGGAIPGRARWGTNKRAGGRGRRQPRCGRWRPALGYGRRRWRPSGGWRHRAGGTGTRSCRCLTPPTGASGWRPRTGRTGGAGRPPVTSSTTSGGASGHDRRAGSLLT